MTAEVTAALERVRPGDVLIVPGWQVRGPGGRPVDLPPAGRGHPGPGGHARPAAGLARPPGLPGPAGSGGAGGHAGPLRPAQHRVPAAGGVGADRGPARTTDRARRSARRPVAASGEGRSALAQAAAAAGHPVAGCPDARAHLRALERADRLARDIERLQRRVKGRIESLARQFDRVLRVLEAWGYVDGWSLTDGGERLARLYHESDLLIAECAGQGLFDGLEPRSWPGWCRCSPTRRAGRASRPRGSPPRGCAGAGARSSAWPGSSTPRRRRPVSR